MREELTDFEKQFIADHADTSEEIKRFKYFLDRALDSHKIDDRTYSELSGTFWRVVVGMADIAINTIEEFDRLTKDSP